MKWLRFGPKGREDQREGGARLVSYLNRFMTLGIAGLGEQRQEVIS
jgi:hypothetical protein